MKKVQENLSRRNLLTIGASLAATSTAAAVCSKVLTPEQVEGPFYPVKDQADKNNDLTVVRGKTQAALGDRVILIGRVVDDNCKPVEGALVEIWQAAASGKYNHPGDPNPAALDPNFQYWGQDVSAADGGFTFKTIVPGAYQATPDWIRPPHLHIKVHRRGFSEWTSQLYFKGNKYNKTDRILQSLSAEEQARLIVAFKEGPNGIPVGEVEITLSSIQ